MLGLVRSVEAEAEATSGAGRQRVMKCYVAECTKEIDDHGLEMSIQPTGYRARACSVACMALIMRRRASEMLMASTEQNVSLVEPGFIVRLPIEVVRVLCLPEMAALEFFTFASEHESSFDRTGIRREQCSGEDGPEPTSIFAYVSNGGRFTVPRKLVNRLGITVGDHLSFLRLGKRKEYEVRRSPKVAE